MKFKIGDRVKVREDLKPNEYYSGVRFDVDMQKMKGRIVTIQGTFPDNSYRIEEYGFLWTDEMFENKEEYTYEVLKKSPIGTKVTFENDTLTKTGKDRYESDGCYRNNADLKDLKDNCGDCLLGKIIKIEEPTYRTVYEAKVEILDETEKRYLEGIIRPFKNKIKTIRKTDNKMNGKDNQYITIAFKEDFNMDFPNFKPNTMYKGMKLYKEYTLEELGLQG